MFAKVYPFSPALVDTLVGLSSTLQRERTALKAMAQLLRDGRDELTVDDIIPAGDLYDVMVGSGEQPLTDEMKRHYANARTLYQERLRPMLLQHSSLTEETAASLSRDHPFRREDRLVKSLLIAALVPNVTALRNLTASRLAALNYGSVQTFIAGTEATQVLTTVRRWAQEIGEVHIGEGNDPLITLQLSGVDYDSVLEMVAVEDNESSRRSLLRRMLFTQLGIGDPGMLPSVSFSLVWRGSKREVEVVFGNIRDAERMPDDTLRATGETWKVVIDYPFDAGGHGPQEDVNRFAQLRADGVTSRTVGWVPMFLTTARQDDLGKLVLLEHLLGGTGDQFERNATHLPVDQRPIAGESRKSRRIGHDECAADRVRRQQRARALRRLLPARPFGDEGERKRLACPLGKIEKPGRKLVARELRHAGSYAAGAHFSFAQRCEALSLVGSALPPLWADT